MDSLAKLWANRHFHVLLVEMQNPWTRAHSRALEGGHLPATGRAYMSEAGPWNDTQPCVPGDQQDMAAGFATEGRGKLPVTEGTDVRLPEKHS